MAKQACPSRLWRQLARNWRQVEFSSFLGSTKSYFFQTPYGARQTNQKACLPDVCKGNYPTSACLLHIFVIVSTHAYIWNPRKHHMSCGDVVLACVYVVLSTKSFVSNAPTTRKNQACVGNMCECVCILLPALLRNPRIHQIARHVVIFACVFV